MWGEVERLEWQIDGRGVEQYLRGDQDSALETRGARRERQGMG